MKEKKVVKRSKVKKAPLFLQKKKQSKQSFRGNAYNKLFFSIRTRVTLRGKERPTVVLYSTEYGFITKQQLEAARKIIRKKTSKRGRLTIKAYPYIPVTKKPKEVRMGKGKGKIAEYGAFVRPGKPIFELSKAGVAASTYAFNSARSKLPVASKIAAVRAVR